MIFKEHSELKDTHAILGGSQNAWTNYSEEKMLLVAENLEQKERGTKLHAFAAMAIELQQPLKGNTSSLAMFVNDAIGFRMTPEQPLVYSAKAYGCADAISFRKNFLRIHDYKSGKTKASFRQLEVYTAFFCLEYGVDPHDIKIELRIYQLGEIKVFIPDPDYIESLMGHTILCDKLLTSRQRRV